MRTPAMATSLPGRVEVGRGMAAVGVVGSIGSDSLMADGYWRAMKFRGLKPGGMESPMNGAEGFKIQCGGNPTINCGAKRVSPVNGAQRSCAVIAHRGERLFPAD